MDDFDFQNKIIYYRNKKAKKFSIISIHKELEILLNKMIKGLNLKKKDKFTVLIRSPVR